MDAEILILGCTLHLKDRTTCKVTGTRAILIDCLPTDRISVHMLQAIMPFVLRACARQSNL